MGEIQEYLQDQRFSEIIGTMMASECMIAPAHTLPASASMGDAKEMMRKKKISGIPIVDTERHLEGMISMEDIIISMERGTLNDPISGHMSRKVVSIRGNEGMNQAIGKFLTYSYGRFPVVDNEFRVIGILTKGDVTLSILERLGNVYLHNKRMDQTLSVSHTVSNLEQLGEDKSFLYEIDMDDVDTAGGGSARLKQWLKQKGMDRCVMQKVSVCVYEAEVNVVIHALGKGSIKVYITEDMLFAFVEDTGPGIQNMELAMKEGYSTASDEIRNHGFGAGMGLPNIKRFADKLVILSDNKGTRIEMLFVIDPAGCLDIEGDTA